MIELGDFYRLIRPIQQKLFLLVGRAILTAVNNSEKFMKIQVTSLKDETITDVERAQEYGFESYPKKNAEAFILFMNGNRDHGIALCVSDREYRPTTLNEGEVMTYDCLGSYILLKKTNIIEVFGKGGGTLEKAILGSTLVDWLTAHTHATPVGPSGPPTQVATLPSCLSNGVKIN